MIMMEQKDILENISTMIHKKLDNNGINNEVGYRFKRPYAIYQQLTDKAISTSQLLHLKKEDISTLNKVYKELPIHSQSDLSVKPLDIASILQKEPDNYIKNITIDLEKQILLGNLENDYESIKKYILNYYANESKKS